MGAAFGNFYAVVTRPDMITVRRVNLAKGRLVDQSRALDLLGTDLLYITSANRSHHLTGAEEEPAHWQAADLVADFVHVPGFLLIEHRDEAGARAAYPVYAPTSVTLLSFHAVQGTPERPVLTIDRHCSLPIEEIQGVARRFGFDVTLGHAARRRLRVRTYPQAASV